VKVKVKFSYWESSIYYDVQLKMTIKFREKNKLFPTKLTKTVVKGQSSSGLLFEAFVYDCKMFIKNKEKIKSMVINMLKEYCGYNSEKELLKLIKENKLTFEVDLENETIEEVKKNG
jgi:hypothetical protein